MRAYRVRHRLGAGGGTAVTVQAMVFGNRGPGSGTGVLFSRPPPRPASRTYSASGCRARNDVVSGVATPEPLSTLAERMPASMPSRVEIARTVEAAASVPP